MRKSLSIVAALLLLANFASIGNAQDLPLSFDFESGWPAELEMKKVTSTGNNSSFCIDIAEDPSAVNGMSMRYSRPNNNWQRRVQLVNNIDLTDEYGAVVSFDWRHQTDSLPNRKDYVQVQYSLNGGNTWNDVGAKVYRYTDIVPYGAEMDDDGYDFWQHYSFSIPAVAYQANVKIGLLFGRESGAVSGTSYSFLDNLEIAAAESECFPPTNVRVYNVTGERATVSWTENNGATDWRILLDGAFQFVTENPYTIQYGLEPDMSYSVSVGTVCGTDIVYSEEVDFETLPCGSITEVYYDFEDSEISECVTMKRVSPADPEAEDFEAAEAESEGDYGIGRTGTVLKFFSDEESVTTSRFILPTLDMSQYADGATLDFMWYHQTDGNNNDYVQVQYSTDGNSWTNLAGGKVNRRATNAGWKQYRFAIPQVGGAYGSYVALLFSKSQNGDEVEYNLYMDDIHLYPTADMPAPMNLEAIATAEGAFVQWTEMGTATEWTVVWGSSTDIFYDDELSFNESLEQYMLENEENYMIAENTAMFIPMDDSYDMYVRANDGENHSPWALKCAIALSDCEAQTLEYETYIQDFEGFSEIDEEEDEDYEAALGEAFLGECMNGYTISGSGRTGFNFGGINEDDDNIHLIYNTTANNTARLVLPAIDLRESESGSGVMVGFNWYHQTSNASAGTSVQLEYTLDGFNWTPVGDPILRYQEEAEWKKYEFYIPEFESNYGLISLVFNQGTSTSPICYLDDIRVAANECYRPEGLLVASVMGTSATLTWEAGSATTWKVVYDTYDPEDPVFDPESMTEYDEYIYDEPTVTLSDLSTEEHYAVFVSAVCDEDNEVFSDWSEVATFATSTCEFITMDEELLVTFDDYYTMEEFLEDNECFEMTENDASFGIEEMEGHEYVLSFSGEGTASLRLPGIDMREDDRETGVMVSFNWYHNGDDGEEKLTVSYSNGLLGVSKGTVDRYSEYGEGWKKYNFYIEEFSSESENRMGYITLNFIGDDSGVCYLDDLKVSVTDCYLPEDLTLNGVVGNTAQLSWEAGDATEWQVVYGDYYEGDPIPAPGDCMEYDDYIYDDPTVQLLELSTEAYYVVYVRTVCNEDDEIYSDWSTAALFQTDACEADDLSSELEYDFEGISDLEELDCFTSVVLDEEYETGIYFDMIGEEDNTRLVFSNDEEVQERLVLPALHLSEEEEEGVLVSFEWFHNGEEGEGNVLVQYSTNGIDWESHFDPIYRYNDYEGWRTYRFDLPDLIGQIGYVGLLFTADGMGECYLDDLRIQKMAADIQVINYDYEWHDDIEENTFITVTDGAVLTLYGSNNGTAANLVIESGAQLVTNEMVEATLLSNIDAYNPDADPADGYRLITSPLDNTEPINFFYNEFDFYAFDQNEDEEWRNYKDQEFDMQPWMGYLYANDHNTMLRFAGIVPSCDDEQVVDIWENEGNPMGAWNLVGNPFTCNASIDLPFYRMNEEGSELEPYTPSDVVNPLEGIFVQADNDNNINTVTFTPQQNRASSNLSISLMHTSRGNDQLDRAILAFGEGRNLSKFMLHPENTRIYFRQNDTDYAIVRSQAEGEMPVSFKASQNGSFTLNVEIENVEMNYLHLIDNLTGADVDLLQTPNYTFEARTTDYASRFRLVFASASATDNTNSESFAFFNGNSWTIANDGQATLQVIDMMGRVVRSESISGNAELNLNQASGVYMLRLINGDSVRVQKVVVR